MDSKSVIVFALARDRQNPEWSIEQSRLPVLKIDRKIQICTTIQIPSVPNEFELVAAIEHTGSGSSGHYASHLRFENEYWLSNSSQPLKKSSDDENFDVEKSTLFLFKRN